MSTLPGLQSEHTLTFSFGENWEQFVRSQLSQERMDASRRCLLEFLCLPDLSGKAFLDVGSGSGLSSLAAYDAGARRVISFDVDPKSVATTTALRRLRNDPPNWEVHQGSVLDRAFLSGLPAADIVYSWGVLHHTGEMWAAVRNAAQFVQAGGLFCIALYTTSPASPFWLEQKRKYNRSSRLSKRLMEARYIVNDLIIPSILSRQSPWRRLREYKKDRGMNYLFNVRDWLGGLPYEHATPQEVLRFGREQLCMELVNIKTGEACTEYLFQPRPSFVEAQPQKERERTAPMYPSPMVV